MSWGKGDPQKDAIHIVVLDEEGRLRDHVKFDNLKDEGPKEQFQALLKHRNPDVIVVGGFSVATKRLTRDVMMLVNGELSGQEVHQPRDPQTNGADSRGSSQPDASRQQPSQNGWAGNDSASDQWGSSGGAAGGWGASANGQSGWGDASASQGDAWGNNGTGGDGWGTATHDPGHGAGGWASASGGGSGQPSQPQPNGSPTSSPERQKPEKSKGPTKTPIIYVNDEVARVYQHSKRAEDEYGRVPLVGRYCIGLARYAQNPLNEYAALGPDLTTIAFDEAQMLVSIVIATTRDSLVV